MVKFKQLTKGEPTDGQGRCYFIAGTPAEIKSISEGPATAHDPQTNLPIVAKAKVVANGYRLGGTYGFADKVADPVTALVDADALIEA